MSRPLLITADETLLEELLRLAAAAGVTPRVSSDPDSALRAWSRAPIVLVGDDLAARTAGCGPPRRVGVHVVAWGPAADDAYRRALSLGAEGVAELPTAESWLVERLTDLADADRVPGPVLGVVGGSGGAGATTFACALGQVALGRGSALVIDCDPLGPGADRLLGLEGEPGVRWDSLAQGGGRLGSGSLRDAVPGRDGLGVLSWPHAPTATPGAEAVREALSAGRRGHDLVVLDLPRTTEPLALELGSRCDRLLVVSGATVPAVASTVRLCRRLVEPAAARLVVRGRGLDPVEVARVTGIEVLAAMPDQRGLAESADLGLGPVRSRRSPLARTARTVLAVTLAELAGLRDVA